MLGARKISSVRHPPVNPGARKRALEVLMAQGGPAKKPRVRTASLKRALDDKQDADRRKRVKANTVIPVIPVKRAKVVSRIPRKSGAGRAEGDKPKEHLKLPEMSELQKQAFGAIIRSRGRVLMLPPGEGKTRVGVAVAIYIRKTTGKWVTILVSPGLRDNFSGEFAKCGVTDMTGIEILSHHEFQEKYSYDWESFKGALIMDEAHRLNTSYKLEHSRGGDYQQRFFSSKKQEERYKVLRAKALNKTRQGKSAESFMPAIHKATENRDKMNEHIVNTELSGGKVTIQDIMNLKASEAILADAIKAHDDARKAQADCSMSHAEQREYERLSEFRTPPLARTVIKVCTQASKVMLITATPVKNKVGEFKHLYEACKGVEGMMPSEFSKLSLKRMASVVFGRKANRTDTYARVKDHTVKIPMPDAYRKEYERVIASESEVIYMDDPYTFYTGVAQATLGLENNPKIEYAIDKALQYMQEGKKGFIHTRFKRHSARIIVKRLREMGVKCECITGETPMKERTRIVKSFNNDEFMILVFTKACGEGVDLKGARYGILMEALWSKAQRDQAAGRGDRKNSHEHLPYSDRTLDIYHLILTKYGDHNRPSMEACSEENMHLVNRVHISADEALQFIASKKQVEIDQLYNAFIG